MADFSELSDFMDDVGDASGVPLGFTTPKMPSPTHPDGRQYFVPAPDALTGIQLSTLADMTLKATRGVELTQVDVKRLRLDDQDEREFLAMVLGDALDEMLKDKVAWPHVQRIGMYAFVYYGISKEAADGAAANGLLRGKVPAPTNRAGRRKPKKTATSSASAGSRKTTKQN